MVFNLLKSILTSHANASFFRSAKSIAAVPGITTSTEVDDHKIIARILKFYRLLGSTTDSNGDSMWQAFFKQHHLEIHQKFINGSEHEAAEILRDPSTSELLYGFDNLTKSISPKVAKTSISHAKTCFDGLIRFAEAIGAICLDYSESFLPPRTWMADEVIQKIEETLGQRLIFPNPFPNEHGVQTSRGVASYRACQALYQAWRIKQLMKNIPHPRVLEIGAGLGRTAFYARLFGIQDYTIVDLPFTETASGYFLARTLGEEQVLLFGEPAVQPQHRIKIIPPNEFFAQQLSYDLIVNVDSFTEMDPAVARAYFEKIETSTPFFLSINHEGNPYTVTVKQLIDSSKNIANANRFPYWMRKGYTEELVNFKSMNNGDR